MHPNGPILRGAAAAAICALSAVPALADPATVKTVFVVAMENHNWTQPASYTANQAIKNNPNAPFINSLVGGTAVVSIGGQQVNIGSQTAYTDSYHSVTYNPATGLSARAIHPSEPNYIWAEAGTNFGVLNDNQPYGNGGTNQNTNQHLSGLMQAQGVTWKSYQEDIDLQTVNGKRVNVVAPQASWVSPIQNISGTFGTTDGLPASGANKSPANDWNRSQQYDYAVKHDPMSFFTDTNGGNDPTAANPLAQHYAPLQQLQADLNNDATAQYNWITPDQFNDQHTTLAGGYTPLGGGALLTGDAARIRQGDDFLKQFLPVLMNSDAYRDNGAIILWWDESEGGDNSNFTIPEIVISPLAHPNVNGLPYDSPVNFTHSSDLKTMQELFNVSAASPTGFLGDAGAAGTADLSDLFAPGAIPQSVPEPTTLSVLCIGLAALFSVRRRARTRA